MIVKTFPLIRPGVFATEFKEVHYHSDNVLVMPTLLSVCAADQRYYFGRRPSNILQKKLPMILIHEAIGIVVDSYNSNFRKGDIVVLLPCGKNSVVDSNYAKEAFFRSSNAPGFCQELISLHSSEIVKIPNVEGGDSFVFTELLSVCFQALRQVSAEIQKSNTVGVWGDGSLGFLMAYLIKKLYPDKYLICVGKHEDKLNFFSFANGVETIFARSNTTLDLLIECVGGNGAQTAINEMIISANPKATILLTGVSENSPIINTRSILEKGLILKGTTRSIRNDFISAVKFISDTENRNIISCLESQRIGVRDAYDLKKAFELSQQSQFKTLITFRP